MNKIIKYIISALLLLSSNILLYFINKLNVLEIKYFSIIFMIITLIYIFIILKLFKKKTKKITKVILSIISIILISIYMFIITYIYNTIDFIENMTGDTKEKQTYSVLVLKNSSYNEITDLKDKNIGFLSTNPNLDAAKSKFDSKTNLKYNYKKENITDLISDLNLNKLDAIVLDNSMIELVKESENIIIDNTKVIYKYTLYLSSKNKKVDVSKESFIFYISGSDSREGLSDNDRSDVNIIVAVNPKTHKILLVNVPRDYYVQLHGTTGVKDKLTHAGIYGIDMSTKTMEDLLDIDINYYVKLSFDTLVNSVDVIDGIDITSEKDFTRVSNNEKCHIKKGTQHVNGNCALAFARERKVFDAGDYSRGLNQEQVITAIINKITSNPALLSKYNQILESIDGSFETNMTYNEITTLVKSQLSNMKSWEINSTAAAGNGWGYDYTYSMGNQKLYVTYPNNDSLQLLHDEILKTIYN